MIYDFGAEAGEDGNEVEICFASAEALAQCFPDVASAIRCGWPSVIGVCMGLDFVELTLAWEDAFGVSIENDRWARLGTPRQLVAHLATVLPVGEAACTTQQAFHGIRRGIAREWGVPRDAVRPATPWSDVLPRTNARRQWARLGEQVCPGAWPRRWVLGGPRAEHGTVGALATYLATTQPTRIKPRPATWTLREIETVVRAVLREEQGLENVALDAGFVRDLRID